MAFEELVNRLGEDDPEGEAFSEIVVERKTGLPRQAGASLPEGAYIKQLRERAERDLYVFTKGVLGRQYLSPKLHVEFASSLIECPPYRKLRLIPREHCKTSMVSHGLPAHALIQPKDANIYLPGKAGVDTRILLAGETEKRASNNLSVVEAAFESNQTLRALWPHVCWDDPRKQAKKWNALEMIMPRNIDYADPSIQAIGVGGAITGARFDIIIKDDLVALEAANSPTVMRTAIRWHRSSRALLESPSSLEFIIGTRWAVFDLYSSIIDGDPEDGVDADATVDVVVRSVVEDGECIYPEKYAVKPEPGKFDLDYLQKQYGVLFWLLYMNSVANPELTDFDPSDLREFAIRDGKYVFEEIESDVTLRSKLNSLPPTQNLTGVPLNAETWSALLGREEYLRMKVT